MIQENECKTEEAPVKKKRGRKPNPNKKNYYFCTEQEKAVVDYISTDDEKEKNLIFNTTLRPAFTKMIESIIRRYNLYPPSEEFQETFDDTISFLMTKLSCFDPATNYKAYSYCGTICKNYLTFESVQNDISDSISYSYDDTDPRKTFLSELTGNTVEGIEKILEDYDKLKLSENEIKVGKALVNLMKNWDDLFAQMGSNKFNKSSILLFLKETTMLNTKEIRDAIRVYKKRYYDVKNKLINE